MLLDLTIVEHNRIILRYRHEYTVPLWGALQGPDQRCQWAHWEAGTCWAMHLGVARHCYWLQGFSCQRQRSWTAHLSSWTLWKGECYYSKHCIVLTYKSYLSKQGRFVLSGNWYELYEPKNDQEKQLTRNIIRWVSGITDESVQVKVGIRDGQKIAGYTDGPKYLRHNCVI